jgi:hypothetical protein
MVDYPKFAPVDDDVALADAARDHTIAVSQGELIDYGDSSPLATLLQGQVYAGGILLRRLNEIAKRITWEFLSLARLVPRENQPAQVLLTVKLTGTRSVVWEMPEGAQIRCPLTSELWTTAERLTIAPNDIVGQVRAIGPVGQTSNVRAGLVWSSIVAYAYIQQITNERAAFGGADAESEQSFLDRCALALATRRTIVSRRDYENAAIESLGNGYRAIAVPLLSLDRRSEELGSVHVFAIAGGNQAVPDEALAGALTAMSDRTLVGSTLYLSTCNRVLIDVEIIVNADSDCVDLLVEAFRQVPLNLALGTIELRQDLYSKAIWSSPKLSALVSSIYSITFNGEGQPIAFENKWDVPVHRSLYVEVVSGFETSYKRLVVVDA